MEIVVLLTSDVYYSHFVSRNLYGVTNSTSLNCTEFHTIETGHIKA